MAFGPTSTPLIITAAHVAVVLTVGLVVRSLARASRTAQRELAAQRWMLQQMLPAGPSSSATS
jgi:hypothetical protein